MITANIHRVRKFVIGPVQQLRTDGNRPFFTRDIIIKTDNGEENRFTIYSDNCEDLFLADVEKDDEDE